MKITKKTVDKMAPDELLTDDEIRGFRARRLPSGRVRFTYRYTNKGSRRREIGLGLHGEVTVDEARTFAKQYAGRVASKADPAAEQEAEKAIAGKTVDLVFNDFFAKYVLVKKLKSADEIRRNFDRLVRPRLGERSIYDVKRSDIANLVEGIVDENGQCMAQNTFAYIRKCFNWFALKNDDFRSPIVAGMAPTKPSDHQRDRNLNDEEIIDLWGALDRVELPRGFTDYARASLLSAQRQANVAEATRDEIDGENWILSSERMKGKQAHLVPLTPALQKLFGNRPGYLFSTDGGKTPISGFSKVKKALDAEIGRQREADGRKPMEAWVWHDLRRTARSIMSRYTTPDVAERVLGHAIPGIRGTYDIYDYAPEKKHALDELARHVEKLVDPNKARHVEKPVDPNVVWLKTA